MAASSAGYGHDHTSRRHLPVGEPQTRPQQHNNGQYVTAIASTTTTTIADHDSEQETHEELLSEALLAVASAEEYAAKIVRLQQACLLPLKEDLATWLNKIMNTSTITKNNFMDRLDNGVVICRLAKIISSWCEQQLNNTNTPSATSNANVTNTTNGFAQDSLENRTTNINRLQFTTRQGTDQCISQQVITPAAHVKLDYNRHHASSRQSPYASTRSSISNLNVHLPTKNNNAFAEAENYDPIYDLGHTNTMAFVVATPLRQPQNCYTKSFTAPMKSASLSTNCLMSSSSTSLNCGYSNGNQFYSNLIRMRQTKIWEEAKCRTFYARDNVSNFIRWSKEFGVNQSVLFESDDLVLHANTRQVVLCLLDVARIACVKHGFTEAPGLVKFEQEMNGELAAEKEAARRHNVHNLVGKLPCKPTSGDNNQLPNESQLSHKLPRLVRNSRGGSIGDATDDLIMRYCLHKEEEAARKKALELEEARFKQLAAEEEALREETEKKKKEYLEEELTKKELEDETATAELNVESSNHEIGHDEVTNGNICEIDSLITVEGKDSEELVIKSPSEEFTTTTRHNLNYDNRVDSLDSGEGRTESASTSHSQTPVNTLREHGISSIPVPLKRSTSSSSLVSSHTSSMGTSDISSSRSSLLSNQEMNSSSSKRHISSDLDGKVMRIAKSYYGKGATKGVKRLSEGKYKIADRIVFVRLLKGHRVMVRIGGGWDTLENFLFRHKSDPSQVIDIDNLLPLETKMSFEKGHKATAAATTPTTPATTNNKFSKLPYYRRSSSTSSTNLSVSNLSVSNHTPTNGSTNLTTNTNSTPRLFRYKSSTPLVQPRLPKIDHGPGQK